MLFETAKIKPVIAASKPPNKPAQQVRAAANTTIKRQPAATTTTTTRPVKTITKPTAGTNHRILNTQQPKKTFARQYVSKPAFSTAAVQAKPRSSFANRMAAAPVQKAVNGWAVYRRQSVKSPAFATTTLSAKPSANYLKNTAVKQIHRPVSGWTIYRKQYQRPLVSATVVPVKQGRAYIAGAAYEPAQRRAGWRTYYRAGINGFPSSYSAQNVQPRSYTSNVVTPVQPVNITTDWNYTQPGAIAPTQGFPVSTASQNTTVQPVNQPHVCHNCGSHVRGCIALPAFTFNSWQLRSFHKKLLRTLAIKILRKGVNLVIATGHTDSSSSEDYNEVLGEKRAATVITELKKQLSLLQPKSHRKLLWKVDSKGESQPVSESNAAANRRVEICLRRIPL